MHGRVDASIPYVDSSIEFAGLVEELNPEMKMESRATSKSDALLRVSPN